MCLPTAFSRFLERPVPKFFHIAASGEGQAPLSCRGYACSPEQDVLWISASRAESLRLQAAVQPDGWLALLATSGLDNESYQVKGRFAGARILTSDDMYVWERERELIGGVFPDLLALWPVSPQQCMAIALKAELFYIQTPGSSAGSLLTERRQSSYD